MSAYFPVNDYLDLDYTTHRDLFDPEEPVWAALAKIKTYLVQNLRPGMHGRKHDLAFVDQAVLIGEGTLVEPGAVVKGPAWIGKNCTLRNGCYVRENVIVGDGVTLGNSCELKNCLVFDHAEVPHFNYVGDSILGYKAHLGAGVVLSNVRLDRGSVRVSTPEGQADTGLRKFGAIVGDRTEIGCNSVLSPGSIIGRDCILYPGTHWLGVLAGNRIVKVRQTQQVVLRR